MTTGRWRLKPPLHLCDDVLASFAAVRVVRHDHVATVKAVRAALGPPDLGAKPKLATRPHDANLQITLESNDPADKGARGVDNRRQPTTETRPCPDHMDNRKTQVPSSLWNI